MNALTVCVDYDDLLQITLPYNCRYFDKIVIVTSPKDTATFDFALSRSNVEVLATDTFYKDGASFAKGLAIEEGLDHLGRDGWICIVDADVIIPEDVLVTCPQVGYLYTPHRYLLEDPRKWSPDLDWKSLPTVRESEHAGYCQFFHADDPVLKDARPWYGTRWKHAAGCDSDFQAHWDKDHKIRLPWKVLHIGPHGLNWHGRFTPKLDGSTPPNANACREAQERMYRRRSAEGGYPDEWFNEELCTDD